MIAAAFQLWYVQPKWNSLHRPIFSRHRNSICAWKTQREENKYVAIQFTKQVRSLHQPAQSNKIYDVQILHTNVEIPTPASGLVPKVSIFEMFVQLCWNKNENRAWQ